MTDKREYMRQWRADNAERIKEYNRRYKADHREREQERDRARYANDPEGQRERVRAYYAKNAEQVKAREAARRAERPERYKAADKRWRESHPEQHKAKLRHWREQNPEAVAEWSARRRMVTNAATERFSRFEIYERDNGKCHLCRKRIDRSDFHLDHLIPLSKGGSHTRTNVAIAHPFCNMSRGPGRLDAQLILA